MKILRLIKGVFVLFWAFLLLMITSPIFFLLFAYDLASPNDEKDWTSLYFENLFKIGGIK